MTEFNSACEFNVACVCGGSTARPNSDCERCRMQVEIERLQAEYDELNKRLITNTLAISNFEAEVEQLTNRKCGWRKVDGTYQTECEDGMIIRMGKHELAGVHPWAYCSKCGGKIELKPEGGDGKN